jgi:AcrR family transcriptional regulator
MTMDANGGADSPWQPFETRRRNRDVKREAVLRTAAQMFLDRGYQKTTLNDVADRLNITKPALYNYFRSKEEILFACWMLGKDKAYESIERIDSEGGSGLVKLQQLIRDYARLMTMDFGMCMVCLDDRELSDEWRAEVRFHKRHVDAAYRRYITEGVADGSVAPCDTKLAAFAIGGALNWIGHWYKPGSRTPDEIAEQFVHLLTSGMRA